MVFDLNIFKILLRWSKHAFSYSLKRSQRPHLKFTHLIIGSHKSSGSSSLVFSAQRLDSNTFLNFCKIQRKNEGNFWGKQNFSITHTFIINVQIQLTQWNWYGELALSICVCILKLTILHLWGCSWGHANFILIRFSENLGKISN